jgi:hypothetical protein
MHKEKITIPSLLQIGHSLMVGGTHLHVFRTLFGHHTIASVVGLHFSEPKMRIQQIYPKKTQFIPFLWQSGRYNVDD